MSPTVPPKGSDPSGFVLTSLADVDGRSPIPLYEQIASRLKSLVGGGVLTPGDPLPSVRHLSRELRINPATVVQAYRLLESAGFAEMRQGAGTFVASPSADQRQRERLGQARRVVREALAEAARLGVAPGDLARAWHEIVEGGKR